ncbi:MAG: right-handed parallel beta-helix repeat-containing protein [bacterium]
MKRFPLFLTAAMLMVSFGCDKTKSPTQPEKSAIAENEAELTDAAAKASRAVIRVPDDYATIQAAVDAANAGDKIVVKASGSPYNEVVFATKPDIEIAAKGSVTLNGNFGVGANNVKISHFNINVLVPPGPGLDGGISVGAVSGVKISRNTITGNSRGIFLNGSTGCLVEKNTCSGLPFDFDAIVLYYGANDNTITRNAFTGNGGGINLAFSHNNVVSGNDCSANQSRGIDIGGSNSNKIKNNICNRNGSSGIAVNSGSNNIFGPGNTANFNQLYGIILFNDASNNTVKKNDSHCNSFGDILDFGTGNTFIKNSTGPLPGGCP